MPIVTYSSDAWARLGKRIRAERERAGLSRQELAEVAGVSSGSVQSAESGKRPASRWPQSLSAIERALGWAPESVQAILRGDEPTPLAVDSAELSKVAEQRFGVLQRRRALVGDAGADLIFTDALGTQRVVELKVTREQPAELLERVADLPPSVRAWLETVMSFGVVSVENGAPYWLGQAYDHAVASLLAALTEDSDMSPRDRILFAGRLSEDSPLAPWRSAKREADRRAHMSEKMALLEETVDVFEYELESGESELSEEELKDIIDRTKRGIAKLSTDAGDDGSEQAERASLSLGEKLEEVRVRAGLTVEDVSELTAMSVAFIEGIERGGFAFAGARRYVPHYIRILADAADVDSKPLVKQYFTLPLRARAPRRRAVFTNAPRGSSKERREREADLRNAAKKLL